MEGSEHIGRPIPWLRIVAEGMVIIVSILLALAADAWWEGRQTRKAEAAALERLSNEFQENAEQFNDVRERHLGVAQAAEALFQFCGNETRGLPPPDSLYWLLSDLSNTPTYDPANGALNSLISSGGLEMITNDSLRVALAGWPALVEDLNEDEEAAWRALDLGIVPYLDERIAWRTLEVHSRNEEFRPERPSDFSSGWEEIFRDRLFENLVDGRRASGYSINSELDEVEASLSLIQRLLEQHLDR